MELNELLQNAKYEGQDLKDVGISQIDYAVAKIVSLFPDLDRQEVYAYIVALIESEHSFVELIDETQRETGLDIAIAVGDVQDDVSNMEHELRSFDSALQDLAGKLGKFQSKVEEKYVQKWEVRNVGSEVADCELRQDRLEKRIEKVEKFESTIVALLVAIAIMAFVGILR